MLWLNSIDLEVSMADRGVKSGLAALMLLSLVFLIVVVGCGKLDKKGPTPPNFAPETYLANVPVGSAQFLANPTVHWYATDRDGYVTMYRYSVQKADDYPDPEAFIEQSRQNGWEDWVDVPVVTGEVSTSGQIRLFAAADPDSFVDQFVFVMAVDNFGAESNVPYRLFSRANHAPGTEVFLSRGPWITGSCRAAQAQNIGIPVQWEGSDTLDYPGKQPDFEYAWEVYGPFDSRIDTTIDGADTTFTVIPDTIGTNWKDRLIDQSFSDLTNSRWTFDQFATLYNLFGDVAQDGVTLFGAFIFQVRTRDDAYVEDPTPATMTFQALKPACERDVMLLDVTAYQSAAGGLCDNCGDGNLKDNRYHPYYIGVFEEAGGFDFSGTDSMSLIYHAPNGDAAFIPPLQTFGRYSLVVMFAEDFWNARKDPWLSAVATYLDMGGNVMIIGNNVIEPNIFISTDPSFYPSVVSFSGTSMQARYFNVFGIFDPYWRSSWFRQFIDTTGNIVSNEEMVAALSLESSLPDLIPDYCAELTDELLEADTCHLSEYVIVGHNVWATDSATGERYDPYPYYKGAVPGVNYFISGGLAEGLYMARSAYGTVGNLDGGLVGYRYQTEGFKTSIFGFPLYAFPRWQAVEFLSAMIDWYDLESL
jgi:hypothetical protein